MDTIDDLIVKEYSSRNMGIPNYVIVRVIINKLRINN